MRTARLIGVLLLLASVTSLLAQVRSDRVDPTGIPGALVLVGGGNLPETALARFLTLAGGPKAKIVLIPTASASADKDDPERILKPWRERQPASVVVLHARSRKEVEDPTFLAPLKEATGVWFGGGDQSRLASIYGGTGVEAELYALLRRGGVIGGTSAGAAIQSRLMITGGQEQAKTGLGFDLLPGVVIDQHFTQRKRQERLFGVLEKHPGHVGVGLDEGTALVVRGRSMTVLGDGQATVRLASGAGRPARTWELKKGATQDLTALRRAARVRAGDPWPATPGTPEVPQGSLVIVGGGGMPEDVTRRFLTLAGGPEALIVVLPIAAGDTTQPGTGEAAFLKKAGATNTRVLPARTLEEVEDPKTLKLLSEAKGVWFGGGRQWRFVDAYEGTKLHEAFRDVLRRGGVIGGSSAGATIQGDYLCRGSPLNNTDMMCEGYERGLAFLPGVAIDQHFSQRQRFADMTSLMKVYPGFLGIGLDEATAIVVRGHVAEVMGRNKVHFYDRRKPQDPDKPDYLSLIAGEKYDVKERKRIEAP